MSKTITVKDLVEFVLKYRRRHVFERYTPDHIALEIANSIKQNASVVILENITNEIDGIVTAIVENDHTLRVKNLLTRKSGLLPLFIAKLQELHPTKQVIACRQQRRFIRYDTEKLKRKLLSK